MGSTLDKYRVPLSSLRGIYGKDAWRRRKAVTDLSLLHGIFTESIPSDKWYEQIDGVGQSTFSNATSVNGKLNLVSGALNERRNLRSFLHPRYEPNRGHLYSSSSFFPNVSAQGSRKIGYFTEESGAYFELLRGILSGVIQTTIDGVVVKDVFEIDLNAIGIDIAKGHVYDIQMQWRGVGDYVFFIDLKPVLIIDYLGERTELSMYNPANPINYECTNLGDEVVIQSGCADISTEGGTNKGGAYGALSCSNESGQITISGYNQPILAVRSKDMVNGRINTRDTLSLALSAYSDQRSILRVWEFRDPNVIAPNQQAWQDYRDGHLEYIYNDDPDVITPMTFDTTGKKPLVTFRVNQDNTLVTPATYPDGTEIYLPVGTTLVFTMHRENGTSANVGVTYEFSEKI